MKSHELLSRRINEVTDLRDKLKEDKLPKIQSDPLEGIS